MPTSHERFGTSPSSKTDSMTQQAKSNMSSMANAAGDQLADAAGQAQQVAQEQLDRMTVAIRRNPLQAAGIAVGVGFALAMLARR